MTHSFESFRINLELREKILRNVRGVGSSPWNTRLAEESGTHIRKWVSIHLVKQCYNKLLDAHISVLIDLEVPKSPKTKGIVS